MITNEKLIQINAVLEKLEIEKKPMHRSMIRLANGSIYFKHREKRIKKCFLSFDENTNTFMLGHSIDVYGYATSHNVNVLLVFDSEKAFDNLRIELDDYRIGRQLYDLRIDVLERIASKNKCHRPVRMENKKSE